MAMQSVCVCVCSKLWLVSKSAKKTAASAAAANNAALWKTLTPEH